jgi:transposase
MFVRVKTSGPRQYLQVVENRWDEGGTRQRVVATLGRLDRLDAEGAIDGLLRSLGRFADKVRVVEDLAAGRLEARCVRRVGPPLVVERLWEHTGIRASLEALLKRRRFAFPVERAVLVSVLQRLFAPGSDRQGDRWRRDYRVRGTEGLELHHFYRAMRWLGDERERLEEELFGRRRDLFSTAELCFFDTTSIYFEGEGGQELGRYGFSKDHRPDRKQMVVGAVVDGEGRPLCAPMWPGNRTDVTVLHPVVRRVRERFGIERLSVVADQGMVSAATVAELERCGIGYILGARMRRVKEVYQDVLSRGGRYREVRGPRTRRSDPAPLKVKEVRIDDRRYVVCYNTEQAEHDRAARQAILKTLRRELAQDGGASLVSNRGYRRFLKATGRGGLAINEAKVKAQARFDGKWVLRTNLALPTDAVALRYKELWRVERLFRDAKSLLSTRPVFHHWDATICGHVFVSFLALVVLHELEARLACREGAPEWADVRRDLDALEEVEVVDGGRTYWLRTPLKRGATAALRAAGVGIPPAVREA